MSVDAKLCLAGFLVGALATAIMFVMASLVSYLEDVQHVA